MDINMTCETFCIVLIWYWINFGAYPLTLKPFNSTIIFGDIVGYPVLTVMAP